MRRWRNLTPVPQNNRIIPRVETLVNRCSPSDYVKAVNHMLLVHGTNAAETIAISDAWAGDVTATNKPFGLPARYDRVR
jgi:hypothetical protein